MPDLSALKQAIATIEEVARRYHSPPELRGGEWRRKQVADRRLVLEALTELAAAGRRHLVARGDETLLRRFEDAVTRFRHALALHQANWPVVSIDPEDLDYLRSRQNVRVASQKLTGVLNEILERAYSGPP